jgi:GNAT superfamily N-acetyltransferase
MNVREATVDDIPACLAMGAQFFMAAGLADVTSFSAESVSETLHNLMQSEDGCLLVADDGAGLVGMAGALAYPFYFNAAARTSQELFWWVTPEARGQAVGRELLEKMEAWAAKAGCTSITMICLPIDSPAERMYASAGYRASERSYIKRI